MSDPSSDDFPLYMSSATINEGKSIELMIVYEGYGEGIDNVLLIGQKNDLPADISKAIVLTKGDKVTRASYEITIPIWEDGSFQVVVEKEGKFVYEPGEPHNLVFRGRGIFLDLRKIYHLSKDPAPPKESKKKEAKETKKVQVDTPTKTSVAHAYDDFNMLSLKPKDFRVFGPDLKNLLLQVLDYLENEKSQTLVFDNVILPDVTRSLKLCIREENRASVYDVCFPVAVFIEKALIISNLIHSQIINEDTVARYKREVIDKIPEVRKLIETTEFRKTTDLIKKEYDDDIHDLKMRFYQEI